jgi:Peroxisomal biogenesis factor 11 (PEX11)
VEALHSALQALSHPDLVQRSTIAMARIAHALFLFADHLLWLGRAGLAKIDAKKWTSIANRYTGGKFYTIKKNTRFNFYRILLI